MNKKRSSYPTTQGQQAFRPLPGGYQGMGFSLAEVFEYESIQACLSITKSRKKDNTTYAFYALPDDKAVCGSKKHSTNPTDALIDLLIWLEGRKEKS